jgi:hypothetical protein
VFFKQVTLQVCIEIIAYENRSDYLEVQRQPIRAAHIQAPRPPPLLLLPLLLLLLLLLLLCGNTAPWHLCCRRRG